MDTENNSSVDKKRRWKRICKATGKCSFCPPHNVENGKKRPRPDRYKSQRKGK